MLGGTSQASITGVGNTRYSKKADRSAERLAIEAVLAAAADAGIEPTQIDGLIPYPGHIGDDVIQAELGINPRFRVTVDMGGCSAVSALRVASMAVMSGAAKHVLLFRGLKGNSGARKADRPSFLPGQSFRRARQPSAMPCCVSGTSMNMALIAVRWGRSRWPRGHMPTSTRTRRCMVAN